MARYIDVDALIAEIESNSRKTWSGDINTVFWENAVKIKDNIKRCIERQPTVDVVPMAEVAPKCAFAYDGETLEHCVQAPCPNFKTVEEIRAEVAREILDYIDNHCMMFCDSPYVYDAFLDTIAPLKKKYGVE